MRWLFTARGLVIGPWPLRPAWFALLVFIIVTASSTLNQLEPWLQGTEQFPWIAEAPGALPLAVVLVLPQVGVEALRSRVLHQPLNRLWYFGNMTITGIWGGALALVTFAGEQWSVTEDLEAIIAPGLRILVLQVVLYGALGLSQQRLREAAERADAAVSQLRSQKELLLLTEEKGRRAVADFLHDRVQSVLVVSTMELGRIADQVDAPAAARLRSVAGQLEEVRSTEVREVNVRLSPNIATVGIEGSLSALAESMAPQGAVAIRLDDGLAAWANPGRRADTTHSAVYRIIEQGVGNAIVHGRASRIDIRLVRRGDRIHVQVEDDGRGLPGVVVPGAGTAVIDAWCEAVEGEWSQGSSRDGGAVLQAWLPLPTEWR